tara:strand:+ start:241 stop:435 length:195 start_codon:yes stop_codon:yes gene_type:complete
VQLTFNNGSSAIELSDTLERSISVGKGFAPSEEAAFILNQLQLSVAGSKLTTLLQVALFDLQKP